MAHPSDSDIFFIPVSDALKQGLVTDPDEVRAIQLIEDAMPGGTVNVDPALLTKRDGTAVQLHVDPGVLGVEVDD